jgi:4-hydroxybenzoate polyprenyltransferase
MAIIRQARFFFMVPAIFALVSAYIFAGNYSPTQLLPVITSFVLVWIFTSSVNNTYDITTDNTSRLMRNQNPVATGELTMREVQTMHLILPVLSIAIGALAGPYWIGLPILAIALVLLYDIRPFRLKDRPFGFLIAPLCQSLPLLFAYAAATSSFALPLRGLLTFAFLYCNGFLIARYLPDTDLDVKLGIHNFSATYGAEATRRFEILGVTIKSLIQVGGILLGLFSPLGMLLFLPSAALQLSILAKGSEALKDPANFRRFALWGLVPCSASIVLGIVQIGQPVSIPGV